MNKQIVFFIAMFCTDVVLATHITEVINNTKQTMFLAYRVPVDLKIVSGKFLATGQADYTSGLTVNDSVFGWKTIVRIAPMRSVILEGAYLPNAKYDPDGHAYSGLAIGFVRSGKQITSLTKPFFIMREKAYCFEGDYPREFLPGVFKRMPFDLIQLDATYTLEARQLSDEVCVADGSDLKIAEDAIRILVQVNNKPINSNPPQAYIDSFEFDKEMDYIAQGREKCSWDVFKVAVRFNRSITPGYFDKFCHFMNLNGKKNGRIVVGLSDYSSGGMETIRDKNGPDVIKFITYDLNREEFQQLLDKANQQVKD